MTKRQNYVRDNHVYTMRGRTAGVFGRSFEALREVDLAAHARRYSCFRRLCFRLRVLVKLPQNLKGMLPLFAPKDGLKVVLSSKIDTTA